MAIELLLARRSFVSALTLAGAAEEIFGVELKNRGITNALTRRHRLHVMAYSRARRKGPSFKQFAAKQNYARNAAKHLADKFSNAEYDPFLRADLETAAINMILRAIRNQELLCLPKSESATRFYGWYLSTIYV